MRQKKLSWSEISGNSVWAKEVSSFVSQWKVCKEHDRLRYISCVHCKRSRDTAQVKWEELNTLTYTVRQDLGRILVL